MKEILHGPFNEYRIKSTELEYIKYLEKSYEETIDMLKRNISLQVITKVIFEAFSDFLTQLKLNIYIYFCSNYWTTILRPK